MQRRTHEREERTASGVVEKRFARSALPERRSKRRDARREDAARSARLCSTTPRRRHHCAAYACAAALRHCGWLACRRRRSMASVPPPHCHSTASAAPTDSSTPLASSGAALSGTECSVAVDDPRTVVAHGEIDPGWKVQCGLDGEELAVHVARRRCTSRAALVQAPRSLRATRCLPTQSLTAMQPRVVHARRIGADRPRAKVHACKPTASHRVCVVPCTSSAAALD